MSAYSSVYETHQVHLVHEHDYISLIVAWPKILRHLLTLKYTFLKQKPQVPQAL